MRLTPIWCYQLPTCGREARKELFTNWWGRGTKGSQSIRSSKSEKVARQSCLIALLTASPEKVIVDCYKGHSQCHLSPSDKKLVGCNMCTTLLTLKILKLANNLNSSLQEKMANNLRHFLLREACPFKNGWIFGKVPSDRWPPPPHFWKIMLRIFSKIHHRSTLL